VARAAAPAGTVTIRPAHPGDRAPNGGEWFAVDGDPGRPATVEAVIANPRSQPVHVRLTTADIHFDGEDPQLVEPARDVGTWIGLPVRELVLAPASEQSLRFTLHVPATAEPGDHIGAVIAENVPDPGGAGIQVITRAATRFYVTVPGAVRAKLRIERVTVRKDGAIAPRWADVTVLVHNTGNVKLATTVKVGGRRADGPSHVLSRSREQYVLRHRLPVWGGPVSWPVAIATRTSEGRGPSLLGKAHVFVLPIVPILLIVLALIGLASGWQLAERRRARVDQLAAELKRLEERLGPS
jgi:hypothetical protein